MDHPLAADDLEKMASITGERKSDRGAEYEVLLEQLRSQVSSLQKENEDLRNKPDVQKTDSSPLSEVSVLKRQLEESKVWQQAAESQIKRLSAACNEAEKQVATSMEEAANGHSNRDDEVKLLEEKYAELDAKFGRLQKRAKQRIQEGQKEREDLENQLAATKERAAQALSREAAIQDDVERVKQHAGEALRALDAERQQLRANSAKLTEELDDLRCALEGKEQNLAMSRRLASEKDQTVLELTAKLKEAEANHENAPSESKEKHQTVAENLSAQLADATLEHVKMTETISTLQTHLGLKESKLAELEAATSGEMVRLGASLEAVKGDFARQELEYKREQEQWQADLEQLRWKLDEAEKVMQSQTAEANEMKSKLESELERQRQVCSITLADLSAAQQETKSVASDFAAYKVRANVSVLQREDSDLLAAKTSDNSAVQETALQVKEAQQIKPPSAACTEAEKQVATSMEEAANGHSNRDDEVKLLEEKYAVLDAKFGRLQKRAKQRIQEVQKEKEELETQLAASKERAAQAMSREAAIQDDVERVRHHAGEALRALDAERQQLRASSAKLAEELDDLRCALEGKEQNLAMSRRLASEKDQTVLELTSKLKEAEANHESALSEFKEKHQTVAENLSAQLADATLEHVKMTETISSLQTHLGLKESKLAELEAATSGEMVRLGASLEAVKGDFARQELEHKREQEQWQGSVEKLRWKLGEAEKVMQAQTAAANEMKSKLESELERQRQVCSITLADLSAAKQETKRVASDFAAYKVRANSVLQKKDTQLLAAKNSDNSVAQETALQVKEAQQESILAAMERDRAVKALQDSVTDYENKLAARDISVLDAEQRIRDLATKLEFSKGQLLSEQEEWQHRMDRTEAAWRLQCDTLEAKVRGSVEADLKNEYTALSTEYNNLKMEFETVRAVVDTTIEEKDREIARLLEDNAVIQRSSAWQAQTQGRSDVQSVQAHSWADLDRGGLQVEEQQILLLARQQAQREKEVTQCRQHIQALQEEITDLERENGLHSKQEALLKEELRSLERAQTRDSVDMTYLKNVILKLLETGEVEALLPVVGMLLQFSPDELKRCHDSYSKQPVS